MDWFKGKSTGNHGFYHQIYGFPVNFPIIQFYDKTKRNTVKTLGWIFESLDVQKGSAGSSQNPAFPKGYACVSVGYTKSICGC